MGKSRYYCDNCGVDSKTTPPWRELCSNCGSRFWATKGEPLIDDSVKIMPPTMWKNLNSNAVAPLFV